MKKTITVSLLLLSLASFIGFSCNKDAAEKKLYIRGRLFVDDNIILQQMGQPLSQKMIMLAKASHDSLNYIHSDTTDAGGYFIFNLLSNDEKDFKVRFSDSIGGYKYYGETAVRKGDDDARVIAHLDTTNLCGVQLTSADSIKGTFGYANISVYKGLVQANNNDLTGATFTATADGYGNMFTFKLKPGIYYVNSKRAIDTMVFETRGKKLEVKGKRTIDTLVLLRTK